MTAPWRRSSEAGTIRRDQASLSPADQAKLDAFARGKTSHAVAKRLKVSEASVDSLLYGGRAKIAVVERMSAALAALGEGAP